MRLTTSQFAEMYIVSASYVRRLKREHRLVVDAEGLIDMTHPINRMTGATLFGNVATRLSRQIMYGKRGGGRSD